MFLNLENSAQVFVPGDVGFVNGTVVQSVIPQTNVTQAPVSNAVASGSSGNIMDLIIGALILLIAIGVNLLIARIFCSVVEEKGYSAKQTHTFAKCFWLGLAGWIYVAALPDRGNTSQKMFGEDPDFDEDNP